jgi:NAD(P) transhydrogenase subunit beta
MHVLLAEAEIDYTNLFEMEAVNPDFATTDLALVVGACDVVNPAAIEVNDTPLSGMPILLAKDARKIVVCNLDDKPGYSGVRNSLYQDPKTILVLGDAQNSISSIFEGLQL